MKNELVVIIVTCDRKAILMNTLERVFALEGGEFDIILWDNNPSGDSAREAETKYPRIRTIVSEKNIGGAGGYQKALEYAYEKGYTYFWCLDDDGIPERDCLVQLTAVHRQSGNNVILGVRILPVSQDKASLWPIHGKFDLRKGKIIELDEVEVRRVLVKKEPYETASVSLLGMFFHRDVIRINGFIDGRFFLSCDDVDFCLRAASNGIKVIQVPMAVIVHPSLNTRFFRFPGKRVEVLLMPSWRLYYYIRNNLYTSRKYYSAGTRFSNFMMLILTSLTGLLENPDKWNTFKNGIRGFLHGFSGKFDGL